MKDPHEMPVLGHVNEDHIVPELQFLERLYRLMVAAEAAAMHGERRLAAGESMGNGLCGLATRHARRIAAPRPMKMGTIASLWRYDAIANYALQPANLRQPAILRCAS